MSSVLTASTMLAVAMQSQPGVYAVLLGSGVSTATGIPTGWGIVRDLVRQIAVAANPKDSASHEAAFADPEAWWGEHGDGELGYASLLEQLAPTPAARQGVLARYFEPTDDERAEGLKAPSKAHFALAELVKRGTVRVILTTNFDRLMEQALEAMGVSPQVISRPEAVNGMAPLAHAKATIVKLHGDYLDLGTRNTPAELGSYPPEWLSLLNQIFSEYGLLVSGWSADWDAALVASVESSTRRYPLYWDSRSSRGARAQQLLKAREGRTIEAAGADELFRDLASSIEALDSLAESPLSTAMAVARVKRYLPDPTRRIDLHDLVMDIANRVADAISEMPTTADGGFDGAAFQNLYERYLDATTALLHVSTAGTWHDPEGAHDQLWIDVCQRLVDAGTAPLGSATTLLERARLIPALLYLSTVGTVAAARGRETLFIQIATRVEGRTQLGTGDALPAGQLLHTFRVLEKDWVNVMPRWGGQRWLYPMSHLLLADLRTFFNDYIRLDADFVSAFHGQEFRIGLIQQQLRANGRGYPAAEGEYVGERGWRWGEPHVPFAEEAFRRDSGRRSDWPWTRYLGGNDSFESTLISHRELLWRYNRS